MVQSIYPGRMLAASGSRAFGGLQYLAIAPPVKENCGKIKKN